MFYLSLWVKELRATLNMWIIPDESISAAFITINWGVKFITFWTEGNPADWDPKANISQIAPWRHEYRSRLLESILYFSRGVLTQNHVRYSLFNAAVSFMSWRLFRCQPIYQGIFKPEHLLSLLKSSIL